MRKISSKNQLLKIEVDGKESNVVREQYATAKLKALRQFGYNSLKLETVESEIDAVINDEKLTVIGMFMQDEIKTRKASK